MDPAAVAQNDAVSPMSARWRTAMELLTVRQRANFALITVARTAVGLCDLLLAGAMYLLFLLLQGRAPTHLFWWMPKSILAGAAYALFLIVLRSLLDVGSESVFVRQIQRLHISLMLGLTQGYGEMQWTRFIQLNRSELANHALHTTREAAEFYHRCFEFVAGILIVTAMTAAIIYQSPLAALGFACTLAGFYGLHRWFIRKRIRQAAIAREKSLHKLQRILAGVFSSGKEIRTYRNQDFFQRCIRPHAEGFASGNRRAALFSQLARIVADQGVVLVFLALIIGVQLRQGDTRQFLGLLAFYFVLSRRMLPLVSQLSLIAGHMESSFENVRIVRAELAKCRECHAAPPSVQLPASGFALQLENVNFSFDEETAILHNVNLSMRKGEIAVLRGVSGIGKTSLLNLIAGVTEPLSGAIRVDRSQIAYVPQEIALLDDTIRNNLLFGLLSRSDEELMRALAAARLSEFVAALPLGLDSSVGDNGTLFSGGERQRLGLARAILRGSQFLLLDEATSALDEENEAQILDNLTAAGAAIILVTHRRNVNLFADRVLSLRDGFLVEEAHRCRITPTAFTPTLMEHTLNLVERSLKVGE
jgi:ABC-type multidrug transport system fused ATPase/permease subunit